MIPLVKQLAPMRSRVRAPYLALVSGVVAGVAGTTPACWPLILVALVPVIASLASGERTRREAAATGLAFGFGYGLIVFSWTFSWLGLLLTTSLPLYLALGMSAYSWLLTVGTPALGYLLWAVARRELAVRLSGFSAALASAATFVLAEVVGVFLFHVVFWGPGSSLAPHFAFGMIGYALAPNGIAIQYAWLGGVFLLSFVVVLMNELILMWWRAPRGSVAPLAILAVVLVPACIYTLRSAALTPPSLAIGLVQTEFDSNFEWTAEGFRVRHQVLRGELDDLMAQEPAMIVLPESSDFIEQERAWNGDAAADALLAKLEAEHIILADSGSEGEIGSSASRMRYYGAPGAPSADKHVLLPQGEYVPYIQTALQRFVASPKSFLALQNVRSYVPGPLGSNVRLPIGTVATRFCSESMSPFLYAYDATQGAQLFVNVASHSWFVGSDLLSRRTEYFGLVRAAESGRWFIQAGNKTSSFVADPLGRVVANVANGTALVKVGLSDAVTPYRFLAGLFGNAI